MKVRPKVLKLANYTRDNLDHLIYPTLTREIRQLIFRWGVYMRLFKLGVIPGWFICILGGCWNLFGIWARIEFILKKLWPEESIMSFFTAIGSSSWFPFALMIIGMTWIWWATRLNPMIKQRRDQLQEIYNELDAIAKDRWVNNNHQSIRIAIIQLNEWKDKTKRLLFTLFGQIELDNFSNKIKYIENKGEYYNSNIGMIDAFYNEKEIYLMYLKDFLDSLEKHPELWSS